MPILDKQMLIKCTDKDREMAKRKAGEAGFEGSSAFIRYLIRHVEPKEIVKLKMK